MTLKEAIELSLEVWGYLVEHPEIECKADLPEELYCKIKRMINRCPLCEYSSIVSGKGICKDCPLTFEEKGKLIKCGRDRYPYTKWINGNEKARKKSATAIVKLLEAALEKENRNEKSN
jgi:hypothetical protein